MDNTREKMIEVKEALGMCYKQGLTSECTGCTYREHNNVCMDALMEDALAVIKCLEEKQATSNESKWISVTERLPELHTDDYEEPDGSRMQFLVSCDQWVIDKDGDQTKARYETGVVFQGWVGEFDNTIRNVTHWMPLPQPPKGE